MKKKTFTQELFIHHSDQTNGYFVSECDMSTFGHIVLGTQTVELNIPDTDPIQAEVEMLEKKVTSVRADMQSQVTQLEQRIQELKCLEVK